MQADWYALEFNVNAKNKWQDFIFKNPLPTSYNIICFIDTMTDNEIDFYIPFTAFAYNNTPGFEKTTALKQVQSFKNQIKIKNRPPKTYTYYYFFLQKENEIIGVANRRISINGNLVLDYIFIIESHRGKGLGKSFYAKTVERIINNHNNLSNMRVQTHSSNRAIIKIIKPLGFKLEQ
jgi:RimJ/RimL family protein N-acetyltransferase